MEQSTYEDLMRLLLGKDSYLLFVFDRLIGSTLKNIITFNQVEESSVSMHLFRQLCENVDQMSEHLYLKLFCNKMKTLSNFNGQVVRLLYSDKSKIMSVHLLNLDPYNVLQKPNSVAESDEASIQQVYLQRSLKRM